MFKEKTVFIYSWSHTGSAGSSEGDDKANCGPSQ
jgi:hypothetical protein